MVNRPYLFIFDHIQAISNGADDSWHYKKSCALNSVKINLNYKVSCFLTELALKKFSYCGMLKMLNIGK